MIRDRETRFTVFFELADQDGFVHNVEGPHTLVLPLPEGTNNRSAVLPNSIFETRALDGAATVDVDLVLVLNQRDEVPLRVRAPVYTGRDESRTPVIRHHARIYRSASAAAPQTRKRTVEIEGKTAVVTDYPDPPAVTARAAPVNDCEIRVAGKVMSWRSIR